jgi:hypothetical protein
MAVDIASADPSTPCLVCTAGTYSPGSEGAASVEPAYDTLVMLRNAGYEGNWQPSKPLARTALECESCVAGRVDHDQDAKTLCRQCAPGQFSAAAAIKCSRECQAGWTGPPGWNSNTSVSINLTTTTGVWRTTISSSHLLGMYTSLYMWQLT